MSYPSYPRAPDLSSRHSPTRQHVEALGMRPYYPQLDGVRAVAAAMVIAFHVAMYRLPPHSIYRVFSYGQTGVDLFFVLSGFLITSILLKLRERDWDEVRRFYIRRSLRIFPLYYGYLIATVLMGAPVAGWYWVYGQNIWIALGGSLAGPGHFWSLSVEEQFYLVWPFLVLFLPRRRLLPTLWMMVIACPMLRLGLVHTHVNLFYFTLTRLDSLAGGALLAVYQWRGQLYGGRRLMKGIAILSLVLVSWQGWQYRGTGLATVQVTKYTLVAALYVSVVGLLLTGRQMWLTQWLSWSPVRYVGQISYGLYVFHQAAFSFCFAHLAKHSTGVKATAGLAMTFVLTLLSWYLYERPFLRMKNRLAPEPQLPRHAVALTGP